MKQILKVFIAGLILLSSFAYADTGLLFSIEETGSTASIDIILCLDGVSPLSCQNYHLSTQEIVVKTTIRHYYPEVGVKVLTPGYQPSNCTPYPNGYCIFQASNIMATSIQFIDNAIPVQDQTITITSTAPSPGEGGSIYNVSATASSGLPVTFSIDASSSAICSISGSTITFNAAGTCTINANQAGNAAYNPAPQVQQNVTVVRGNQTINFDTTPPSSPVVNTTYNVSATATSGLPVTISIASASSAICTLSGSTVTFIAAGTCTINADQGGNVTYNPAPQVQQIITVIRADQTITFGTTPPTTAFVGGTYTVTATASSGLTVTITIASASSAICSLSGSLVSFNAPGTCTINADQGGNTAYNPAPQAVQIIDVSPPSPTSTTLSSSLNPALVNDTVLFSAQVSSARGAPPSGTVTFTATLGSTPTTLCSNVAISAGLATCSTSFPTAGSYSIVAAYSGAPEYASSNSPPFNQSVVASLPPGTVPSAPTNVTAIPGNGQVSLSWLPPSDGGGAATANINYTVSYWVASGNPAITTPFPGCNPTAAGTLTCTVTGLSNGTTYAFKVIATNTIGTAAYLAGYSSTATPSAGIATLPAELALSGLGSGQSRSIRVINNSNTTQTITAITGLTSLPSGTEVTANSCTGATLTANGGSCFITITPGTTVSLYQTSGSPCDTTTLSTGDTLQPSPISLTTNNALTATTNVYVVKYGCQYQGGYLFNIDDSTPPTGSVGGKVLTAVDQSTTSTWSLNGAFTSIWGIDETSTTASPSPNATTPSAPATLIPGQLNCNGGADGACGSNNILTFYGTSASYAPGICLQTLDNAGTPCTSSASPNSCYADWYLPAICEWGAFNPNFGTDAGCGTNTSNIANNLYLLGFFVNELTRPSFIGARLKPQTVLVILPGTSFSKTVMKLFRI